MILALAAPRLLPLPQFSQPPLSPTEPNPHSFLSLLSQPLTLSQTKSVHAQILKHNLHRHVILTLRLHSLYPSSYSSALLSSLLQDPDLLTFNLLIKSFSSTNPSLALHLFCKLLSSDFSPDPFTLPPALNACVDLRSLPLLLSVHTVSVKSNLSIDPFVASSLIDAYLKCGQLGLAVQVLDELPDPDLPTYNAAITGLSKQGEYGSALRVFTRLRAAGLNPNRTTLSSSITACGRLLHKGLGRAIHGFVVKAVVSFQWTITRILTLKSEVATCPECHFLCQCWCWCCMLDAAAAAAAAGMNFCSCSPQQLLVLLPLLYAAAGPVAVAVLLL